MARFSSASGHFATLSFQHEAFRQSDGFSFKSTSSFLARRLSTLLPSYSHSNDGLALRVVEESVYAFEPSFKTKLGTSQQDQLFASNLTAELRAIVEENFVQYVYDPFNNIRSRTPHQKIFSIQMNRGHGYFAVILSKGSRSSFQL